MSKKNKIVIGKFYKAYGGPAHPSQIYAQDTKHKTYKSIRFGTSRGRHMTRIHPIQEGVADQYVHNRPFEGVRSDYGNEELSSFKIDSRDSDTIEAIKLKKPNLSQRARKRYKK